jgi:hypothetical protein
MYFDFHGTTMTEAETDYVFQFPLAARPFVLSEDHIRSLGTDIAVKALSTGFLLLTAPYTSIPYLLALNSLDRGYICLKNAWRLSTDHVGRFRLKPITFEETRN